MYSMLCTEEWLWSFRSQLQNTTGYSILRLTFCRWPSSSSSLADVDDSHEPIRWLVSLPRAFDRSHNPLTHTFNPLKWIYNSYDGGMRKVENERAPSSLLSLSIHTKFTRQIPMTVCELSVSPSAGAIYLCAIHINMKHITHY